MSQTAHEVGEAADTSAAHGAAVSDALERMRGNLQTVASASQELAASIGEIGAQVTTASSRSSAAAATASRTTEEVQALSRSVDRIGDILALIQDIAEQTNLLALNATIEAARAGEAGKGFAVVAGEVKSLASQTAKATEEIEGAIRAVQETARGTVASIGEIATAIDELDGISQAVAAATTEQESATGEIARSVENVSGEADQVVGLMDEMSACGARTTAASGSVRTAADGLAEEAAVLADEVRAFLEGIADGDRRESMDAVDLALSATVTVQESGQAVSARTRRLSPALVHLVSELPAAVGQPVTMALEGLAPVRARVAQVGDGETVLQLPMDRESLEAMATFLEGRSATSAAA
jgi:methyl-accepting chemotaxis protein